MRIGKIIRIIRNVPRPIPVIFPKPQPIPAPDIFRPKPASVPSVPAEK